MRTIISYNIFSENQAVLTQYSSDYEYKLISIDEYKKLLQVESDSQMTIFIGVDTSIKKEQLVTLLEHFRCSVINVLFIEPSFDLLLVCHNYGINFVFNQTISSLSLVSAHEKVQKLDALKRENIPQEQMLNLFSIAAKVKTDRDLYLRFRGYFDHFESVLKFAVLEIDSDNVHFEGDFFEKIYEKYISKIKLPKHYISYEKVFNKGNHCIVLTPSFVNETKQVWLAIELKTNEKSFILNDLFYKYLENLLIYRKNKEKERNLEVLAATDEVTGLYNQRQLSSDLEQAVLHHEKVHEKFSIMFIDVDHFKNVNDNYGHVIGSKLLMDLGNALNLILRESDHIYRYGGDEFVIIMPSIDNKTVHEVALRVLQKIKDVDFRIDHDEIYKMSISIGIAEYPTDAKSAIEIVKFADEMMYKSKKSGRGKVFHVNEVNNVNVSAE